MKRLLVIFLLLFASVSYAGGVLDFTADTSPTSDDIIYVVNDPTTPVDRKVTLGNLPKAMSLLVISDWPSGLTIEELGFVGDVTSAIQAQINTKGPGDITSVLSKTSGDVPILYQTPAAFTSTDTTPDVSAGTIFRTANASATTISDFDAGAGSLLDGQLLIVFINDANTTLDFTFSGLKGWPVDYLASIGDLLFCMYSTTDSKWHCIVNPKTLTGLTIGGFTASKGICSDGSGNLVACTNLLDWVMDTDLASVSANHDTIPSSKAVKNKVQYKSWSFDPKAVCDGAVDRLFLMSAHGGQGVIITAWKVSFEADPTTEADLDLKRADAWIGVANAAVMDVLDTTAGVSSESTPANINGGAAIAEGKVIYLEFGTAYTETTHQIIFEMWYSEVGN